ncbi:DUF3822 family protein [Mucilaginibacter sp.]
MSNHIYNYRDSNLTSYQVNSNYILLLHICTTTFSYAIVYQNKLMAWAKDCKLEFLADPGEDHELLGYEYKHMVVGMHSSGFTLVPSALFSADKLAEFGRYLDIRKDEKVLAQTLDHENRIVYKVSEWINNAAEIYGLSNTVFENKGWINAIANTNLTAQNMYINVDSIRADILYFANGKIRFYNRFEFNNPDELAYYAVYVAQELKLEPKNLTLVVSGDINVTDKNAARLADFFNSVEQNEISVLILPAEVKSHQILALAALSLCVSSEVV